MTNSMTATQDRSLAIEKKKHLEQGFFKKGIAIALFSGIAYGLYSAFVVAAQTQGIWVDWSTALPAGGFMLVFILPTLASAINDSCSALWALAATIKQGKLPDFIATLGTKPGLIMVAAAMVGGPIGSAAYIIALSMAGTIVTPVAALCPAIGSIISRVLYKQKLGARGVTGILICMLGSGLIGVSSLTGDLGANAVPGICLALVCALAWGIEGCVAGYGTSMIDSQVGITIRQCTSGLGNLLIILPLLTVASGNSLAETYSYVAGAFTNLPSLVFFIVSGMFAYLSYMNWYRGNSMCGTALGMACNGTYAFFVPLCTWIIVGLFMGFDGYALPAIAWIAAVVMVVGVTVIAVNPLDFFRKEKAA